MFCRQRLVQAGALLSFGEPCVLVCSLPRHARHDPAPGRRRRPAESDSELSVSGFLSVASYSCEEDEGKDASLLQRHSAPGGPSGMSGEGDHGNQAAQRNGVEAHRWAALCMRRLFAGAGDEMLERFADVLQSGARLRVWRARTRAHACTLAAGMSDNFSSAYSFVYSLLATQTEQKAALSECKCEAAALNLQGERAR